ncbi:hypothetical protein BV25DRAFT_749116 [Artomyces pyxidatus]|uniref:Uncharacterized protein n=1 Tax=Artomyces pyxidatus TaxID=48021 RepID=A0ACB8T0T3_9AGAM|nr:hypothetical protein BV25DRAFT_749116 [Artomyces pyxidatus]
MCRGIIRRPRSVSNATGEAGFDDPSLHMRYHALRSHGRPMEARPRSVEMVCFIPQCLSFSISFAMAFRETRLWSCGRRPAHYVSSLSNCSLGMKIIRSVFHSSNDYGFGGGFSHPPRIGIGKSENGTICVSFWTESSLFKSGTSTRQTSGRILYFGTSRLLDRYIRLRDYERYWTFGLVDWTVTLGVRVSWHVMRVFRYRPASAALSPGDASDDVGCAANAAALPPPLSRRQYLHSLASLSLSLPRLQHQLPAEGLSPSRRAPRCAVAPSSAILLQWPPVSIIALNGAPPPREDRIDNRRVSRVAPEVRQLARDRRRRGGARARHANLVYAAMRCSSSYLLLQATSALQLHSTLYLVEF